MCLDVPHMKNKGRRGSTLIMRWTMEQLDVALEAVEANTKIKMVGSWFWDSLLYIEESLFGATTSHKRGRWVSSHWRRRRSLWWTSKQLQFLDTPWYSCNFILKEAEMILCQPTPWAGGLLGWSWVKWCWIWHPDLSSWIAQGLIETSRVPWQCLENVNGFYTNL